MAFTYDLTTDIGKVRLLISDKVHSPTSQAQFTDAEVTAFLTMASDVVKMAAVYALESWAATLSDTVDSEKIGDYAYTRKTVANKLAMANTYRAEVEAADNAPVLEWAEMDLADGSGITAEED